MLSRLSSRLSDGMLAPDLYTKGQAVTCVLEFREQMWKILATKIGEKWETVERKVLST